MGDNLRHYFQFCNFLKMLINDHSHPSSSSKDPVMVSICRSNGPQNNTNIIKFASESWRFDWLFVGVHTCEDFMSL